MSKFRVVAHNIGIFWRLVFMLMKRDTCVVIVENNNDIKTFSKGLRGKRHLKSLLQNAAYDIEVQPNGFRKVRILSKV